MAFKEDTKENGRNYELVPPEKRRQIELEVVGGKAVSVAAKEHGVPKSTVYGWVSRIRRGKTGIDFHEAVPAELRAKIAQEYLRGFNTRNSLSTKYNVPIKAISDFVREHRTHLKSEGYTVEDAAPAPKKVRRAKVTRTGASRPAAYSNGAAAAPPPPAPARSQNTELEMEKVRLAHRVMDLLLPPK